MNWKRKSTLLFLGIFLYTHTTLSAQGTTEKKDSISQTQIEKSFQVSAYFQGQYQSAQKDVYKVAVGADNEHYNQKSFNRTGLRRAFVSAMYQTGIVYGLVTIEMRDRKKIWFSDAFINITDPWTKRFNLTVGSLNPFFGYELSVSPSKYELVEGTGFIYNLLPDIYDIGASISYQAPEKYGSLKLNLSMVAGNGVHEETDSRRDFIGTVTASTNKRKPLVLSGGLSYYRGSIYQGTENIYEMKGKTFELNQDINNIGKYAKREYFDVNTQLAMKTPFGLSQLRGEYIFGTQPSGEFSNESPYSGERLNIDTYIRKFRGGYVYYLQQITNKLPLTFMGGYSYYDPNTKVSGNDIGKFQTNATDIRYQTIHLGLIWYPYPSIRVQGFYEMPFNEKSINLQDAGYDRQRKDNVLTLRIQYKY